MATADEDGHPLDGLDRLVHEPARLMVLATLAVVEHADATYVQTQTGLTWGNLSSHLTRLEDAGYVRVDKVFVERRPKTVLAITDAGRGALDDYRDRMRQVLDQLPD